MLDCTQKVNDIFAVSRRTCSDDAWNKIISACGPGITPAEFSDAAATAADALPLPPFLTQLISLEWQKYQVAANQTLIPQTAENFQLNPTLDLAELDWKLCGLFEDLPQSEQIEPGRQIAVIWRDPLGQKVRLKAADNEDLLALKIAEENTEIDSAISAGASFETVAETLRHAVKQGMLVPSRLMLRRNISIFDRSNPINPNLIYPDDFTLQWHITHTCDLHCKHCYDRSKLSTLTLEQGEAILDDLQRFCRQRYVKGHVCFSGGNPLLYPQFFELYAAAASRGFSTSILGNPTTKENLQKIIDIQKPGYFQTSLEGLEQHNDFIRGKGFFKKVFAFLDLLREMEIESAVMLTLTKDNIDQVLPLADLLRGHADYFTFNRLCPVGEGANLLLPSEKAFLNFLETYVQAAQDNPILGYKDNLINIVLDKHGKKLFDGCTGYGCGAAFNFIAVLPDGQAHACRKFPSPIGNLITQSIADIYDSPTAASYRRGTIACDGCRLRHVCGGCLASLYGLKKNISKDLDPYCFIDK